MQLNPSMTRQFGKNSQVKKLFHTVKKTAVSSVYLTLEDKQYPSILAPTFPSFGCET